MNVQHTQHAKLGLTEYIDATKNKLGRIVGGVFRTEYKYRKTDK